MLKGETIGILGGRGKKKKKEKGKKVSKTSYHAAYKEMEHAAPKRT